jgi:hypothetical protein
VGQPGEHQTDQSGDRQRPVSRHAADASRRSLAVIKAVTRSARAITESSSSLDLQ